MMKNTFITLLLLCSLYGNEQELKFPFPPIIHKAKNISNFVPQGWIIRDSVMTDFNSDQLKDFAIVIQTKKPYLFNDTDCFSDQPFYPKILIIAFQNSDKTYILSITTTKLFGTCNWGVQGADPFQKLELRKNSLGITFLTGGTNRNWFSFYFKFIKNDWYTIGADAYQYWAGHTDGKDAFFNQSINLLTGDKETYYEDENKNRNSYKKTKFKVKPLIKLSDFDDYSFIPFDEY